MARLVSFLVLVTILVLIAIVFVQVMAGFFVPLFLAALLAVVVQPLYRAVLPRCRGYRHLAAGVTTALVTLIVLVPVGLVVGTAVLESLSLVDRLQLGNVRQRLSDLRRDFGLQIPQERDVRQIETTLEAWRQKQRHGEALAIKPEQVQNLLDRLAKVETWLADQPALGVAADPAPLRTRLEALRDAPPDSVEREEALLEAEAEFREFKRNLLGGTYRAWLTEWVNPSDEQIEQLRRSVLATAGPVFSLGTDTVLLGLKIGFGSLITIVTLFFVLAEGAAMLEALIRLSPLDESHVRELAAEFDRACRAIVTATLLSAAAQGVLAGVGFYVCGLRGSVALLSLLTMVVALVPFTGAAVVWVPVALYLYFFEGNIGTAVGLAVYGTVVISLVDNIIKPLVLHGQSKLHPLLALLSVLGGVRALGPIGIVVGPMVVVFLITLLRIVQRELSSLDRSSWTFWRELVLRAAGAMASESGKPERRSSSAGSGHPSPPPASAASENVPRQAAATPQGPASASSAARKPAT
jgi:predicted PurR-regulated permease PerM